MCPYQSAIVSALKTRHCVPETKKLMDIPNRERNKITNKDDDTNILWDLREIRANILREEKKEILTVSKFQLVVFLLYQLENNPSFA